MLVPIICSSDVTHLTNFSGDKKAWPIYMSIGNILSRTRNKPSKHATILLSLLPVPAKMLEVTSIDSWQRETDNEVLRDNIDEIFFMKASANYKDEEIACEDQNVQHNLPPLVA